MFASYIKIALRQLWKNKLYNFIHVFSLSIALTAVIVSILYFRFEHSYDSFHKSSSHLFRINTTYVDNKTAFRESSGGTGQVQGPTFKSEIPEIQKYVRFWGGDIRENVRSADKAFTLGAAFADPDFFKVFSFPLIDGDASNALSGIHSIAITEKTALKFFGKTHDVLGRRLDIEDNPDSLFASFIISAVIKDPPPNSSLQFDILIPFAYLQIMFNDNNWLNAYLNTFVLLNPGTDLKKVEEKFVAIHNFHAKEQLKQAKSSAGFDKHTFYTLQPVTDMHLSREGGFSNKSRPAYSYFLMGIAFFILLMASINFINLNIANSLNRAKEIGIRKVTGSSKMQVILQFLIESAIICLIAFGLAIVFTQITVPIFNQLADRQIRFSDLLDGRMIVYFVVLLLLNIFLAGFYPAWLLANFQPKEVLYNKPTLTGRNRLGRILVVLQFSIAISLLIGSAVYYRQMNFIRTSDLGYNPYNIVRVEVPFKRDMKTVYSIFKNELSNVPGIQRLSLEGGSRDNQVYLGDKILIADYKLVDPTYLTMLEIPIRQGRNFSSLFGTDKAKAVIVNESFVRMAGLKDPIGTQLQLKDWYPRDATIIGVIQDYHQSSLRELIKPEVLAVNDESTGTILIKIDRHHMEESLTAIGKVYKAAVPASEYKYTFWDEQNANEYQREWKWQKIINSSTILSLLICCMGLFGLTHLATRMRIKEIGIRKVLGASITSITILISRDFLRLVLLAFVIAVPFAWYFTDEWLRDYAYRTKIGASVFAIAGLSALLISLITIGIQAFRAGLSNPIKNLRTE